MRFLESRYCKHFKERPSDLVGVPIFYAELADHQHLNWERKGILSVSESKLKKNHKSCVLTTTGREKLNEKLNKRYPNGYNVTDLAGQEAPIRGTLSKILNSLPKPVNYSSLQRLFTSLELGDVNESDFENPPKTQKQAVTYKSRPLAQEQNLEDENNQSFTRANDTKKNLKEALRELNYCKQKSSFITAITKVKPATTFLIHGENDEQERWLINLLTYKLPYVTNAWVKRIKIPGHRKDITTLWESLAGELGIEPSPTKIAEQLYQHWEKKTVILAIYNVNLLRHNNILQEFMKNFWQYLVAMVNQATESKENNNKKHRLVLFLINNSKQTSELEKYLFSVGKLDENQPHIPLVLEKVEPFEQDVVELWVGCHDQVLRKLWKSSEPLEQVMLDIVKQNNHPVPVFKGICECFDLDWYKDIINPLAL